MRFETNGAEAVSDREIEEAAEIIRRGGLVAFPTETSYGLAVDPLNSEALSRLFAIKRRSPVKPVLTLVRDPEYLPVLAREVPHIYKPLIRRLWPGALTLIFPGLAILPRLLTGDTGTIGIRISSHPAAQALVRAVGGPITATSANISGLPAALNAADVAGQLGGRLDLIIDGGPAKGGPGSTVVGRQGEELLLIRPGSVPYDQVLAAVEA